MLDDPPPPPPTTTTTDVPPEIALACEGGDGQPHSDSLLPLEPGSCWQYKVTSPDETEGVTYKQVTLLAPTRIQTSCGDNGALSNVVEVVPLVRTVSDGSSAVRFMSVNDGAVWWEEDAKRGGPDEAVAVTTYCAYDGNAEHANERSFSDAPDIRGDSHKLRVASDEMIQQLAWSVPYAERIVKDGAVDVQFCDDDWHVDIDVKGRPRHIRQAVPAGTFDVVPLHRSGNCYGVAGADDAVPPAPERTEALFEFAPGVGKIFERTETQEIEELMTWRIGPLDE